MDITTTVTLTQQDICYLFIAAFEGGSNYWVRDAEPTSMKDEDIPNPDGVVWWGREAFFTDDFEMELAFCNPDTWDGEYDSLEKQKVNAADTKRGLETLAAKYPHISAQILAGEYDAADADCFLQCVIHKDIIYG
jgi:hypothetical protein